jgi:hypothetical protein
VEESIEKHKQAVKEVIEVYFLLHFFIFYASIIFGALVLSIVSSFPPSVGTWKVP